MYYCAMLYETCEPYTAPFILMLVVPLGGFQLHLLSFSKNFQIWGFKHCLSLLDAKCSTRICWVLRFKDKSPCPLPPLPKIHGPNSHKAHPMGLHEWYYITMAVIKTPTLVRQALTLNIQALRLNHALLMMMSYILNSEMLLSILNLWEWTQ